MPTRVTPSDDLNVTKNHRMIEVQASCILEFTGPGCTIFLISGMDKWHKLYQSAHVARLEARTLKLPDSIFESSNDTAPTCVVDLDRIEDLGYRKG
jgi:hypothetical protein